MLGAVNVSEGLFLSDIRYIHRAARFALRSTHEQFRVGAVLVSAGRVTVGWNTKRNDPMVSYASATEHAEERCLRIAGDIARGSTIYVVRILKLDDDHFRIARPCIHCTEQLFEAGVKKAVWSTNSGIDSSTMSDLMAQYE